MQEVRHFFVYLVDWFIQHHRTLHRENEELRYENEQLRQYVGLNEGQPLDSLNQNGKRIRTDVYRSDRCMQLCLLQHV